jgi:hypothetical protein
MLNKIRKATDSIFIRILLFIIISAFIGWGIKDVLQGGHSSSIVSFTHADSISEKDFESTLHRYINNIQKQTLSSLSDEEIKKLNIKNIVLKQMINEHLLKYLASYYDLDLSPDAIVQFAKEMPEFHNEHGIFDIALFKANFRNSKYQEEEFLRKLKTNILTNNVTSIFLESFKTPNIMSKNLVDYLSETRYIDIVEMNLEYIANNFIIPTPNVDELKEFYNKNISLFQIPEMRKISYIEIDLKKIENNIIIENSELLNFYNQNKETFGNKSFNESKDDILLFIKKQKSEKYISDLIRNLDDSVAGGMSLNEISQNFKFEIITIDYLSQKELDFKNIDIRNFNKNIFETNLNEVSYPVELQDKNKIFLYQIDGIRTSHIEKFEDSKDKISLLWQKEYLSKENLKFLEENKNNFLNLKSQKFKNNGLKYHDSVAISRFELNKYQTNDWPLELLFLVFKIKNSDITQIVRIDNKAYIAKVINITKPHDKVVNVEKDFLDNIKTTIRNGMMEELINYLGRENKIKVNKNKI